jgi:hypothetical protein
VGRVGSPAIDEPTRPDTNGNRIGCPRAVAKYRSFASWLQIRFPLTVVVLLARITSPFWVCVRLSSEFDERQQRTMEGKTFDRIVKSLAISTSRRSVIGSGLAAAAALLTQRSGAAAQVTICHFTSSANNPYNIITVDDNSVQLQSHLSHGDTLFVDCCLDEECAHLTDQCNIGECIDGLCTAVPTPGVACDDGDPCTLSDICTSAGTCVGTELDCSELTDQCNIGECQGGACVAVPTPGVRCDDGNACTVEDTCDTTGACVGSPRVCDDGDVCTTDSCDPGSGCRFDAVVCPVDETCCPGVGCTNLASDPANCRECGNECPDGFVCCEGICTAGTCLGICDRPIICDESSQVCGPEDTDCLCGSTIEGGFGCGETPCTDVSCGSSAACVDQFGIGAFCETTSCCGVNQCVIPCGSLTLQAAVAGGRSRGTSG